MKRWAMDPDRPTSRPPLVYWCDEKLDLPLIGACNVKHLPTRLQSSRSLIVEMECLGGPHRDALTRGRPDSALFRILC